MSIEVFAAVAPRLASTAATGSVSGLLRPRSCVLTFSHAASEDFFHSTIRSPSSLESPSVSWPHVYFRWMVERPEVLTLSLVSVQPDRRRRKPLSSMIPVLVLTAQLVLVVSPSVQPFTLTDAIQVGIFGDSFGITDVDN